MRTPTISVIIPTYNRAELTQQALRSVLQQSYTDFETLIIDDGSNPTQKNKLQEALKNKNVRYYEQKNKGVSAARNLGAQHARGQWLAFLDSDDQWLPEKLENQIQHTKKQPKLKIIHTEEIWIRNNKTIPVHKKYKKSSGDLFNKCLQRCAIGPSTVMIEKKLFLENSGFDESFPVCEDYELWLRLCHNHNVGLVDTPLVQKYAGHQGQLSEQPELDYWRSKALLKAIKNPYIEETKKDLIKMELLKKLNVLEIGYQKYQRPDKLAWVAKIKSFLNEHTMT